MPLRFKLLLIALVTAVFPLAGWRFVAQMEDTLREAQEQALLASGRAIAQAVLSLEPGWAVQAEAPGRWYAHSLKGEFLVDGYFDDWQAMGPTNQRMAAQDLQVEFRAALSNQWLYLWLDIDDRTPIFPEEQDPLPERHDHVVLIADEKAHRVFCFRDGELSSLPLRTLQSPEPGKAFTGVCRRRQGGYVLELRVPRVNLIPRLGLRVLDYTVDGADLPRTSLGSLDPTGRILSYPVVSIGVQSAQLTALTPPGVRLRLLSPDGWMIARAGDLTERRDQVDDALSWRRWLRAVVYRSLLAPPLNDGALYRLDQTILRAPEARDALAGTEKTGWRSTSTSVAVVLTAAVPIGGARGAVVLEREADALLIWTNSALASLVFGGLLSTLLAGGVLFGYTSYLSYRIRRLRNAAETVLTPEGRLRANFPRSKATDEVGDLSRSFAKLLDQLGQYNDYLRSLTSKLSHELSTPLAIVRSSLENLEHEPLPDSARPYAERALAGVERLRGLLRAMSEASRIEQAMAHIDAEQIDLRALINVAVAGYRGIAGDRRIHAEVPLNPLPLFGSPELIHQALDKLVDNALGFTPAGGWVKVSAYALDEGVEIAVSNNGPPLPQTMQGKLFDSLVSLREKGTGPHLGLGLYIVRLVADAHRGSVHAEDLPDGEGVVFRLRLKNVG